MCETWRKVLQNSERLVDPGVNKTWRKVLQNTERLVDPGVRPGEKSYRTQKG